MKTVFVDANVFLRFFTRDDDGQHEVASKLFSAARKGTIQLITGPPVLFEIAWTLKSAYRQPSEKILAAIEAIMVLPGMSLTDEATVGLAIAIARHSGQEFSDAYIAASVQQSGADELATFNTRHFSKNSFALRKLK